MPPTVANRPPSAPWSVAMWLALGPALLLAGVVLMMAPDAWTVSHLTYLAGTLAMLPAAAVLHRLLGGRVPSWVGWCGLALMVLGALALAGQFVIDLTVMRLASGEHEAAGRMFDHIQGSTMFALTFYTAGPALLFTGLAVFGATLVTGSATRSWPGWALIAGSLLMAGARITGWRPGEALALALILVALTVSARPAKEGDLRPRAAS